MNRQKMYVRRTKNFLALEVDERGYMFKRARFFCSMLFMCKNWWCKTNYSAKRREKRHEIQVFYIAKQPSNC